MEKNEKEDALRILEKENAELKRRLESQIEGTSRLGADCDGWRDKYWALMKEKEGLWQRHSDLMDEAERMSGEITALRGENTRLRGRNIIERLLNK